MATIDVAELQGLLDRIAPLIAPPDHEMLTMLLKTHLGLLQQLRESTATIARLRRLAGIESSEKTRVVLSRNKGGQEGSGPQVFQPGSIPWVRGWLSRSGVMV